GSSDGQKWRDQMRELMDTEGSSALRRAKLTRSFNNGYRSYSRTYNVCSQSAQTAISRFLAEGAEIAESLAKTAPWVGGCAEATHATPVGLILNRAADSG